MIIYISLALLLCLFLLFPKRKDLVFLAMGLLCFFGLFRGETVGADVLIYCKNIERTTFAPSTWSYYTSFEPGYNIIIAFYNLFFSKPLWFIGLCNVFFVFAYYKYSKVKVKNILLSFFFVYMIGYYLASYNIIRQYFAISLCLLLATKFNFEDISTKKCINLAVCIIFIALMFHNTTLSLLSVFIYITLKKYIQDKIFFADMLLILSIVIYKLNIIPTYLGSLNLFLLNEKTTNYYYAAITGAVEETGYSFLRILLDSSFVAFLMHKNKSINAYIFMMLVAQVFVNLFGSLNPLFARVPTVLFVLSIPIICKVWEEEKSSKAVIISYCIIIFTNLLIKNYGIVIPYMFA